MGRYCRTRLLVFSLLGCCQCLCGSQKIDLYIQFFGKFGMARHLFSLIIGEAGQTRGGNAVEAAFKSVGQGASAARRHRLLQCGKC